MIPHLLRLVAAGHCIILLATSAGGDEKETQGLIAILESDAPMQEKAQACRQLGETGTREAVPALAKLLSHEVLGTYARTGLERIPAPEAVTALRNALGTMTGNSLIAVITSLSALRDGGSVAELQKLSDDDDPSISKAAFLALGRIASPESSEFLLSALTSGREQARENAAAAALLAGQTRRGDGTGMALKLFEAVRSTDLPLAYRVGATRGAIMARASNQQATFLVEQLKSDEPAIRNVAMLTIRNISSSPLADALHNEIPISTSDIRNQLIAALVDCHNESSFEIVRGLLDSDDVSTRIAALSAIGSIDGPPVQVTSAYLQAVVDRRTDREVQAAIRSLTAIDADHVDGQIVTALDNTHIPEVQISLIDLLGARNAVTAQHALLEQTRSVERTVRISALRSLKGLVRSDATSDLIECVKAAESSLERTAAENAAISACDTVESKQLILDELKTAANSELRASWIRILTPSGYRPALPVIVASLLSSDPETRSATITHLSKWPNPAPVENLLDLASDDSANRTHRQAALIAAVRLIAAATGQGQTPPHQLLNWLQRAAHSAVSVPAKRQLVSALGRFKDVRSLSLLTPYLEDDRLKTEAAYAIVSVAEAMKNASDQTSAREAVEKISGITEPDLLERIRELQRVR